MAWICPSCYTEIATNSELHQRACRNHPGVRQLRRWARQSMTIQAMADKCDVSRKMMTNWLDAINLKTAAARRGTDTTHAERQSRDLDLVEHLRLTDCQSCERCNIRAICRAFDARGLWVFCEMPERDFVKDCIRRGLVPAEVLERPVPLDELCSYVAAHAPANEIEIPLPVGELSA